ncbi:hypothetical protein GR204_20445 [Rhizobium leguminosarum]|uniref:Uncharacterized protein n=1 Tax=Rhizobium leguminosarum TaxID=384 RepID=A0A6P0B8T0_RHILE|nr:hypothetical protein [Rhizobium leguminosarum]NEI42597.1 hypothetical protein [Rhizobium leguminosarum]
MISVLGPFHLSERSLSWHLENPNRTIGRSGKTCSCRPEVCSGSGITTCIKTRCFSA